MTKPSSTLLRALSVTALVATAACTGGEQVLKSSPGVPLDAPRFVGKLSADFRHSVINVVNFDFDSDRLDSEAMDIIAEQAEWILEHPDVQFSVTGHTDRVGNVDYNMDLGLRRANAVLAALVNMGVREEQLIAMVTMGEENPLIDTEERERINRRTVTEVLGLIQGTSTVASRPIQDDGGDDDDDRDPPRDDPNPPPSKPNFDDAGNPMPDDSDDGDDAGQSQDA